MKDIDFRTLTPTLVSLILFVATVFGKTLDELTVTQLVTAVLTLVGIVLGIIADHRKPQTTEPKPPIKP